MEPVDHFYWLNNVIGSAIIEEISKWLLLLFKIHNKRWTGVKNRIQLKYISRNENNFFDMNAIVVSGKQLC